MLFGQGEHIFSDRVRICDAALGPPAGLKDHGQLQAAGRAFIQAGEQAFISVGISWYFLTALTVAVLQAAPVLPGLRREALPADHSLKVGQFIKQTCQAADLRAIQGFRPVEVALPAGGQVEAKAAAQPAAGFQVVPDSMVIGPFHAGWLKRGSARREDLMPGRS